MTFFLSILWPPSGLSFFHTANHLFIPVCWPGNWHNSFRFLLHLEITLEPKPYFLSQNAQSGPRPFSKVWKPNCRGDSNDSLLEHPGLSKGQPNTNILQARWLSLKASWTKQFPICVPKLNPSLVFPNLINGNQTHIHLKARNLKEAIRFKISKSTSIPLSFLVFLTLCLQANYFSLP